MGPQNAVFNKSVYCPARCEFESSIHSPVDPVNGRTLVRQILPFKHFLRLVTNKKQMTRMSATKAPIGNGGVLFPGSSLKEKRAT